MRDFTSDVISESYRYSNVLTFFFRTIILVLFNRKNYKKITTKITILCLIASNIRRRNFRQGVKLLKKTLNTKQFVFNISNSIAAAHAVKDLLGPSAK